VTAKRVIITGATGMIGGHALQFCLDNEGVSEVTSIGRRSVGIQNPKLAEMTHGDYADYSAIGDAFDKQDIALFCIGVYTGAVPDDEFRKITVDYTVAFAQALHARSPEATFCLLSGAGADRREKSRVSFARYKGMAENALLRVGFPRVHIFRPAYIYPVTPRKEPNVTYRISRMLWPILGRIVPNAGINSDDLALAMVHTGLHGTGAHTGPVLENRDIRALAEEIR
jgi:uncharacterized protein YbjT (DUF2867 family)